MPVRNITRLAATLAICSFLNGCTHSLFTASPEEQESAPASSTDSSSSSPVESLAKTSTNEAQTTAPAAPDEHDLWQRIRQGYRLNTEQHPLIDTYVGWFQSKQNTIEKSSYRATPLLYHIVESIEARGLPTELALIPLLESGYRVHARSRFGAVGPWQFMPATGRQYGLTRTGYLDKRRDIVLATDASLRYLEYLHAQFNHDWLLAIAAYNAGPGTIRKAQGDSQQSFWQIAHRLPPETRQYVPKLLAAAKIIGAPADFNQTLHAIPNRAFFESLEVTGPADFSVLETLPDWDKKLFRRLNGGLNSDYFGDREQLTIRVPVGTRQLVAERLKAAGPPKIPVTERYLVRKGDTLGGIATRFNVPISDLRKFNGIKGHNIRAGKTMIIPKSAEAEQPNSAENSAADHRHIVKRGDSFWTLGRRYAISARTLARHNGHAINATLYPGQLLLIPKKSLRTGSKPSSSLVDYVVKQGDSLWSIARQHRVKLADLKRWNPVIKNNLLRPGQKLVVHAR